MLLSFLTNNKLSARDLGSAIAKSPILKLDPLGGILEDFFRVCNIIMPHSLFKFLYFMIFF